MPRSLPLGTTMSGEPDQNPSFSEYWFPGRLGAAFSNKFAGNIIIEKLKLPEILQFGKPILAEQFYHDHQKSNAQLLPEVERVLAGTKVTGEATEIEDRILKSFYLDKGFQKRKSISLC